MTPHSSAAVSVPVSTAAKNRVSAHHLWRRDEFLAPIETLLPSIKVLSLDVFDTLIFRTCRNPEDVFLEIGQRAEAAGLFARGLSAGEFASLRHRAQSRAYATLGREPRLEDIYALIPGSLASREDLIALELDTEADFCVLNPSIRSLITHCNERGVAVVLLSDMYLGEQRVRGLLARAGFDAEEHVSRVLVSVDAGTYKMTGASYGKLRELFPGVEPHEMLHIGDNLRSDVIAARAAGLHAIHYDVVRHDPGGTLALEGLVAGHQLPELDALRRLAASLGASLPAGDREWFRTGATVLGPFVSALVDWTIDQCEESGVTLIAPLMREAHFLTPLLTRAVRARGLSIDIQPLYVSRHSVALAGIRNLDTEFVPRILDNRRHFTIGDLFALIGTPIPREIVGHANTLTTSAEAMKLSSGQSLRAWTVEHLLSAEVRPVLQKLIDAERGRLVDYLDNVFGRHAAVATLDIGFFGQIQRALSTALAGERHPARVTHLLGFGHGPIVDDILGGSDVRTFAGGYGSDVELVKTIHRSAPVIEQLLQGLEGTTTGYLASGGRAMPVREKNPLPGRDLAFKTIVQDGATAFHHLWLHLDRTNPALTSELVRRRGAWCRLVHRLIATPTRGEADRLGSLHDDVNFGSNAVLPFCPEPVTADVAAFGVEAALRKGAAVMPAVWPHGVITRVDPAVLLEKHAKASDRPFVALTFGLARQLDRARISRIVGYGTGEAAIAFAEAAAILGLEVAAFIDSDTRRHGQQVSGIPVTSLDAAVALEIHTFVVLSVAHAHAISDTIRRRYVNEPHVPLIFDLVTSTPTKVKHP